MGDIILSHKYCSKTDLEEESWKKHTMERPAMSSLGYFLWRPQLAALRCVVLLQEHPVTYAGEK